MCVGAVPSNARMMCSFVYLPSFDSPNSADYALLVGSTIDDEYQACTTLELNAKVQGFCLVDLSLTYIILF